MSDVKSCYNLRPTIPQNGSVKLIDQLQFWDQRINVNFESRRLRSNMSGWSHISETRKPVLQYERGTGSQGVSHTTTMNR